MVGHIVDRLRQSPIVTAVEVAEAITEESFEYLRVKAEIVDGSTLHVRELLAADRSKYAYQWQTASGETLLRWDNAPHHPDIPTHPDHKHDRDHILPSPRASIEDVLAEIADLLKQPEPAP
jgi:hypothetical protein